MKAHLEAAEVEPCKPPLIGCPTERLLTHWVEVMKNWSAAAEKNEEAERSVHVGAKALDRCKKIASKMWNELTEKPSLELKEVKVLSFEKLRP